MATVSHPAPDARVCRLRRKGSRRHGIGSPPLRPQRSGAALGDGAARRECCFSTRGGVSAGVPQVVAQDGTIALPASSSLVNDQNERSPPVCPLTRLHQAPLARGPLPLSIVMTLAIASTLLACYDLSLVASGAS